MSSSSVSDASVPFASFGPSASSDSPASSDAFTPSDAPVPSEDFWLTHPLGRISARAWRPGTPGPGVTEAPPIVLLHDSLGCIELWRDFPAVLARCTGRSVYAYDRLGFGRSDARTGLPSANFIAEEAQEVFPSVCEQLGLSAVVVMGHSVGGIMAIHCAAGHADRCVALVTLAAQTCAEERTRAGIRATLKSFEDPAQMARLARYHGDKAAWVLAAWGGSWLGPDFEGWSMTGVLPQVRCPVLAIHGDRDEYSTTIHPDQIGQYSGGPTRIELMPGVGHFPHRERQGDVLGLIQAWMPRTEPPA